MLGACAQNAAIWWGPRRGETHSPSLLTYPKYSLYSLTLNTLSTHLLSLYSLSLLAGYIYSHSTHSFSTLYYSLYMGSFNAPSAARLALSGTNQGGGMSSVGVLTIGGRCGRDGLSP